MKKENSVSLKISIPESLKAQFKSACALKKITMNDEVVRLIKKSLEDSICIEFSSKVS